MSWKEILKNYKPLAHAVEGARKEGKEKIWGKIAEDKYAPKYNPKTYDYYGEQFNNPEEAGKYEMNRGLTRLDHNLRNPTPRGQGWQAQGLRSKNLVLTNSDGSPRTVSQHNEEYEKQNQGVNKWLGRLDVNTIKRLGKNPDTMTLQEYVQLREEGKIK